MQATYSPEDNKLRLYASSRLDSKTYERVKKAGFSWATRQKLFVAQMWTPEREDLLLELCGSIEPEETTLRDRAESKAERLSAACEKAQAASDDAHAKANKTLEKFWGGQPILVGHHSEARARREHARIDANMRKSVDGHAKAQELSDKAAASLKHAEHKNSIDTRLNRIKRLESDLKRVEKNLTLNTDDDRQRLERWRKHYIARLEHDNNALKAQGYESPKPPTRAKVAPIVNYPGEGFMHMTKAEYAGINGRLLKISASNEVGAHRQRVVMGVWITDKLNIEGLEGIHRVRVTHRDYNIFITDSKRIDPPKA